MPDRTVRSQVKEYLGVIRRVYWRTSFKVATSLYGAVALAILLRGEFASEKVQKEYLLKDLIPRVPAWLWLAVALVVLFVIGVVGSVRVLRDAEDKRKADLASQQDRNEAAIAAERVKIRAGTESKRLEIEQRREYEAMRPVLEGRIVPVTGRDFGSKHCLQVRILSSWPLSSIYVQMPADPRLGYMRRDLEARRFGDRMLFRPGDWIEVGGVNISPTEAEKVGPSSAVKVRAKCRDEERVRCWEDIVVNVMFELDGAII